MIFPWGARGTTRPSLGVKSLRQLNSLLAGPRGGCGLVVPIFKKRDQSVCSYYRGNTLVSLPGKVYARVQERRVHLLVEHEVQEEQCSFRPNRGTLNQFFTLLGGT